MIRHRGGCHCGRVRFEGMAPARIRVSECNCSMCSRSGYLHLIVPADRFTLVSGRDALTTLTPRSTLTRKLRRCLARR